MPSRPSGQGDRCSLRLGSSRRSPCSPCSCRRVRCPYPPALEATEISSAKVCGASECREVSDPQAATALAVGHRARGTDAPVRGLPWYKSTLTIRAEAGGEVDRVSVTHRGALRRADARGGRGLVWVTLPSESKEAYAKLTAGLTPRPARTLPRVGGRAPVARVDEVCRPACAATPAPASDGSNVWIVALGGGALAALMAGLLLSDPPPPRVDAASGARGTGVGTVRSGPESSRGQDTSGFGAALAFACQRHSRETRSGTVAIASSRQRRRASFLRSRAHVVPMHRMQRLRPSGTSAGRPERPPDRNGWGHPHPSERGRGVP